MAGRGNGLPFTGECSPRGSTLYLCHRLASPPCDHSSNRASGSSLALPRTGGGQRLLRLRVGSAAGRNLQFPLRPASRVRGKVKLEVASTLATRLSSHGDLESYPSTDALHSNRGCASLEGWSTEEVGQSNRLTARWNDLRQADWDWMSGPTMAKALTMMLENFVKLFEKCDP